MWLWNWIDRDGAAQLLNGQGAVHVADLAHASCLEGGWEGMRGRNVLIATADPLSAALALIELDGVAHRLVLCPPDLQAGYLPDIIAEADLDSCVFSAEPPPGAEGLPLRQARIRPERRQGCPAREALQATEWILMTSGTSGPPKLVLHTLSGLTSAFSSGEARAGASPAACVWSTFYDIRRYGGLQILLRALAGHTLVITPRDEPLPGILARLAAAGVTHVSGTASHWRAVLMSGAASLIAPRYVRLSGEIADQSILDGLRAAYPSARIAHAFASTEAGVAFEVEDGLAGFPAGWIGAAAGTVPGLLAELRIRDGCLQMRSGGTAERYLGSDARPLRDPEGFVDTADRVERRAERYHFMGRSGGIINVGGLKVHPEEVESVLNAHPWVHLSRVRARRSPITGAVVTAEVVLADRGAQRPGDAEIAEELLQRCRTVLAPHKVPVSIRVVAALPLSAAGKLLRVEA